MSSAAPDRPPIAFVEWVDSAMVASKWDDREETVKLGLELEPIVSTGFLVAQDDHTILLALALNENRDDVAMVMSIPRVAIRRLDIWAPWKRPEGFAMSPDGDGGDWVTGTSRAVAAWVVALLGVGGALAIVLVAIALGSRR